MLWLCPCECRAGPMVLPEKAGVRGSADVSPCATEGILLLSTHPSAPGLPPQLRAAGHPCFIQETVPEAEEFVYGWSHSVTQEKEPQQQGTHGAHTQPPLGTCADPGAGSCREMGIGFVSAPALPFPKEQQHKNGLHSPDEMHQKMAISGACSSPQCDSGMNMLCTSDTDANPALTQVPVSAFRAGNPRPG